MLFTRCPECDTTFRITDEALEKAHGRVRCGRCSSIFNAHDELRADPHGEPIQRSAAGAAPSDATAQDAAATQPEAAARGETAARDEGAARRDPETEAEHIVLETRTTFATFTPADDDAAGETARRSAWTLENVVDADAPRARGWLVAATIAAVLLLAQVIHHFRDELATESLIGAPLAALYAALGAELDRQWDVGQYQILESEAATETNAAGRGNLTIRSRIQNDGPRTQPLPLVRLKLLDRWQEPIGARVFEPNEYLAEPHGATMAAGDTIEAELVVVDPGPDAYGYEVDICVAARAHYECANDTVFQ